MKSDFFSVKEALDELAAERENFAPDEINLAVEYDNGPGQVELCRIVECGCAGARG